MDFMTVIWSLPYYFSGFPVGAEVKVFACNAGDLGSIPGSGRSPGEMATHSSIFAWRIPWTEEPGGLPSTGLQRVGHDWSTSLHFTSLHLLLLILLLFFFPTHISSCQLLLVITLSTSENPLSVKFLLCVSVVRDGAIKSVSSPNG